MWCHCVGSVRSLREVFECAVTLCGVSLCGSLPEMCQCESVRGLCGWSRDMGLSEVSARGFWVKSLVRDVCERTLCGVSL